MSVWNRMETGKLFAPVASSSAVWIGRFMFQTPNYWLGNTSHLNFILSFPNERFSHQRGGET